MTLKVENEASVIAYLSVITIMNYVFLCYSYMCTHMHMQVFNHEMKQLALTIKPCPPGHALMTTDSKDEYECKCNTDDQNIADCLPNEGKIILEVCTISIITFM